MLQLVQYLMLQVLCLCHLQAQSLFPLLHVFDHHLLSPLSLKCRQLNNLVCPEKLILVYLYQKSLVVLE